MTLTKLAVLRAVLEQGHAHIHLDSRVPGVVLPEHLLGQSHVHLDLPPSYGPLSLDAFALRARIHFTSTPFSVEVPWHAIYAIGPAVWPANLPRPGAVVAEPEQQERPRLRLVPGGET